MRSGEIGRLPLKRADRRDRPKRIFCAQAPQFVRIRRTVEHVPMQRPPMNSMGDEKRVEPRSRRPRDIRLHSVADRQNPLFRS